MSHLPACVRFCSRSEMLDYDWSMLSGDEATDSEYNTHMTFQHYDNDNIFIPQQTHFSVYDPYVGGAGNGSQVYPYPSMMPMPGDGCGGYFVVPKSEEVPRSRIGLNLGGRMYFSAAEDRLYCPSRPVAETGSVNLPKCQAEGCNADLTYSKHYHRRHKVCEFHSKASTVMAAGLTQRFCQQCSRFHLLSEFDNGKRSCRKRLADHNRRRRKTHQTGHESQISQLQTSSSDNITTSPAESSGADQKALVMTVAVLPS